MTEIDTEPENEDEHEDVDDASRTTPVLARLTASDVHIAAKALPSKTQQQLARSLGVPITVVTSSGSIADIVRRRSRRLDTPKAAALGRELADACVNETIVALGDHHDNPSYDDLLAVLDPLVARWGARLVALMLASTADGEFNAAAVCARVLDEDPRFTLDALGPVEPDAPVPSIRTPPPPAVSDAEVAAKRELRKQRRASKKAKQPAKRAEPPSYRRKRAPEGSPDTAQRGPGADTSTTAPRALTVQGRPVTTSTAPMRRATVIGKYDDLRYDDEMVSAVVHVFIPFAVPTDDGEDGKRRPCVVIAACAPDSLVVRPCYSEGGARADDWRSVRVSKPRAAGLDKNSYVDNEEVVITRAQAGPARGWLDRDDWNAL